jgi:hypothetical protein
MFNDFFSIVIRNSDCVEYIAANPFTGVVRVLFNSGHSYQYNGVSRRAIVNLLNNPNMSLGFWINSNCVDSKRAIARHRYTYGAARVTYAV